jgi:outer membrane protein assembly factor BamB
MIAYGKLYLGTLAGVLQAIDVKTGELVWSYNNTQPYTELMWGGDKWPIEFAFLSGGKVYLLHTEHSGNSPLPRGAPFVCLDAETGEVIFRVDGAFRFTVWGGDPMIADSTILLFNTYDNRIYAIGKGPSATTVTAPDLAATLGSSLVIRGTVTDVSAGMQEFARTSRFPNGVPVVADESVGEWMKYVYMQFPLPSDVKGVEVTLSVLDSNGNYRDIGKTTTNSDGFFTFNWTPDIEGQYTVYASFAGSEGYWPSHGVTSFAVDPEPPAETAGPEPTAPSMADQYLLPATGGIIAAVIGVGVVLALLQRKRQ